MKKLLFFLLLSISIQLTLAVNSNIQITHYSSDNGLPQSVIMDMYNDQKGFMWLGTWDGLSKFDGYQFKNYKVTKSDKYVLKSNRVQKIYGGNYNYIWFQSYDEVIHCFRPDQESYWGLQSLEEFKLKEPKYKDVKIFPSGNVWLMLEKQGLVLVKDSLFNTELYNTQNQNLIDNDVNEIFEDWSENTWLLTANGIVKIDKESKQSIFFHSKSKKSNSGKLNFFSAYENENFIFFGSANGNLYQYSKVENKFTIRKIQTHSNLIGIHKISENKILLHTVNDGLIVYNLATSQGQKVDRIHYPALKSNTILKVLMDKSENLWFETYELGIYKLNLNSLDLKFFQVQIDAGFTVLAPVLTYVFEDIHGNIWVQPKGGGFSVYNKQKDQLEPFYNNPESPDRIFSNILHAGYTDKQGNLWLCTRTNGLDKIVFSKDYFKLNQMSNLRKSDIVNEVRSVMEDNAGNLWVATKDRKVKLLDSNKQTIGYLDKNGNIVPNAYFAGMVYASMQDAQGNIWLGTKGEGLFKLKKVGPRKYEVTQYKNNPSDPSSLSHNAIYTLLQDKKGRIWVGTYGGGVNLLIPGTTKFKNYRNSFKDYPYNECYRVRHLAQGDNGMMYVGTTGGLLVFDAKFDDFKDAEFKLCSLIPGDVESLSNNDVHNILITENNTIFLATFGGGINKVEAFDNKGFPDKFKSYNKTEGIPSEIVLALLEDEQGFIWASGENSLTKFNPETESFENFYQTTISLKGITFSEASNFRCKTNEMLFGAVQGLVSFFPNQIIQSNFKPYIALTGIQFFNEDKDKDEEKSKIIVEHLNKLVLNHKQKYFTINFAALDYTAPENIHYAYMLEGLDNDWIYVQNQRLANYTNLPKGKYVFKVKSTNSEGVWVENVRELPIEVLPSFWESNWAVLLYLLIIGGLIFTTVRILLVIYRLRTNVKVEKQLAELKLRFFTDISHEIRTPLTMITAPVDFLINKVETSDEVKKHLKIINQNTNRLLRMVNQILDFRKIQFTNLKVSENEIAPVVANICDNFLDIASMQNVDFRLVNNVEGVKLYFDEDCVDKILMNLLSNAFKYTPSGKMIKIGLDKTETGVMITVVDEGIGMSDEKKKNLFTRFASFNSDASKPSTGIGLSMVKDLADKHGATIDIQSELEKGTTVKILFPFGIDHFGANVDIITNDHPMAVKTQALNEIDQMDCCDDELQNETTTILVVEDDADLREFMRTMLESDFKVLTAEDGLQGLALAVEHSPDIVVSDIMMPNKDGVELLKDLRADVNTSHIPVILLTAKTNIESKLEALEIGADDYITKPFSMQYFLARVSNLILQRKRLQEIYRGNKAEGKFEYVPQPLKMNSKDEELMSDIVKTIEDNMENFDFSVEDLCSSTNMSRSSFFKKIKSMTGVSPVEFIRDIKMKRAAQLLESGQFRVKEITFMIGISDSRYFSKCFKDKYGVTPLDYKTKFLNKLDLED